MVLRYAWLLLTLLGFSWAQAAGVTVQPLGDLAVFPEMSAPATVESPNDSNLGAEITAVIAEIPVSVGQAVKAGDVLVRLDDHDYRLAVIQAQAALEAAQARLRLAEFQLASVRALAGQGSASEELLNMRQAERDAQQAELASRQAALESAQRNLERTRVRAPFAGVVVSRPGKVGERLGIGEPLVRLVQRDGLEVSARVRESDIASLVSARQIEFQGNAGRFPLRLRVITPVVDTQVRTREARLTFVKDSPLPGSPGRLSWRDNVPHLPAHLIQRRNGALGVFTVRDGKASFVVLDHAQEGRPVAVASLPSDTRLAVEGRHRLQDGDAVEPR